MQALQKHVGKRVRELREQKGISQEALAEICNLHRTYIGLIERGERNLSVSTIEVIARGLDIPPSELFTGTEAHAAHPARLARKKASVLGDFGAHIATIKQILIDARLTDSKRYDSLYKASQKKNA